MTQRFAGYAAVFDRPDRGGDIIRRGAFAGVAPGLPLFWGHDPQQRIGTIDAISEDDRGLRVIASTQGVAVRAGHGLSFGYRVRSVSRSACGTYRELTQLDLVEVSLVAQPMQPLARVLATLDDDPKKETTDGL